MELTTLTPLVVEHLEEMGQETMVIHGEGSGVGNPSYHTNRGGFGNIHSNGKLIWSSFFRIATSYLDFWFKQLDISGL